MLVCEAAQWCANAGCLLPRRKPWTTVPVRSHAHPCWRPARARCVLPSGQPWSGLSAPRAADLASATEWSFVRAQISGPLCPPGTALPQPSHQSLCDVTCAAALLPAGWPASGVSAPHSVASASSSARCAAPATLASHLESAPRLCGHLPCSSVRPSVTAWWCPLGMAQKNARM